ncbi:MAG: dephospho-CoA kinase [Candidatus Omnitrophota bacterium]
MSDKKDRRTPLAGKVIGVTGNPGAGKSAAARLLEEKGARVISGDSLGYEMLRSGSPVFPALIQTFGEGILGADGEIDRTALGEIVFGSPEQLQRLNCIVHPPMLERIRGEIERFRASQEKGPLVVDAALLYEWGIEKWFDKIILVAAPKEIRRNRFLSLRGGEGSRFDKREESQIPQEEKEKKADAVLYNQGDLMALRSQIELLFDNRKD